MKTIRHINYKLLLISCLIPLLGFSQFKKETTESFNVDKNPMLKLELSHADIIVSTWNKNKVEVKTTLSSEASSQEEADALFEAHEVKVLGNSNRIEVTSDANNRSGLRKHVLSQLPPPPPKPMRPNASSVKAPKPHKPSKSNFAVPPPPPVPPMEFNFDFEAFKEDGKAYLLKFKNQIDSTSFREDMSKFKEEMMKWKEEMMDSNHSSHEFKTYVDSLKFFVNTVRAEAGEMIKELRHNNELHEIKSIVKKTIEIKVPSNTSFEVYLRNSKFKAETINNLTAKLRYSDLELKKLTGESSEINLNYSNLTLESANQLSLSLVYSKKVDIGMVSQLNVKSKMSELNIKHIGNKALINGSYGKLSIGEIDPKFTLIDISLEKSKANIKLPENVSYRFYAKSSNSKLENNAGLDLKKSENFENVIYTNKESKDGSRMLTLTADYSKISLD